jgi:hypothetical protein
MHSNMSIIDPTVCFLPWLESGDQQPLNFEHKTAPEYIQRYVPRLKFQQGDIWGDIRISHNVSWDNMRYGIGTWLQESGTGLWRKRLQYKHTQTLGYLLYSTRSINTDLLSEVLKNDHNLEVTFRYQVITTGQGPIPEEQKVRALYVITSQQEYEQKRKELYKIYHPTTKKFPLALQLRFIPWVFRPTVTKLTQLLALRRRQAVFLKMAIQVPSWEIVSLDTKPNPATPSLREYVMGVVSCIDKPGAQLFIN